MSRVHPIDLQPLSEDTDAELLQNSEEGDRVDVVGFSSRFRFYLLSIMIWIWISAVQVNTLFISMGIPLISLVPCLLFLVTDSWSFYYVDFECKGCGIQGFLTNPIKLFNHSLFRLLDKLLEIAASVRLSFFVMIASQNTKIPHLLFSGPC